MSLKGLEVFALIPARGGSKGIKNKNLVTVQGKSLIDFTIEASLESKFIDAVYVSSDSKKILERSKNKHAIPVTRPSRLASDHSTATEVVFHFYDYLVSEKIVEQDQDFYLSYLQPTSPLRSSKILDESYQIISNNSSDSLISLVKNKHTPYKFFTLNENGLTESLFDEKDTNKNRQDLKETYRANGAIYTFLMSRFIKNKGFPSNASIPFIMSHEDSIDIDSYEDLDDLKSRLQNRK